MKLKGVFPQGTGFVLVFDFMVSDLSEVIRNADCPLTPAQVKSYMLMLLKGVAFLHHNNIMHRVGPPPPTGSPTNLLMKLNQPSSFTHLLCFASCLLILGVCYVQSYVVKIRLRR